MLKKINKFGGSKTFSTLRREIGSRFDAFKSTGLSVKAPEIKAPSQDIKIPHVSSKFGKDYMI